MPYPHNDMGFDMITDSSKTTPPIRLRKKMEVPNQERPLKEL
jgi:hypothetical protein